MASISISIAKGANQLQPGSYTVGTQIPAAGDFEFRWNQTDTGGLGVPANSITRLDAIKALEGFIDQLQSSTFTFTSGTPESFP